MSKKIKTILLTIGIVLLGFMREYLFVNINWIYLHLTNGRMNAARQEFYALLEWTPNEILILKWALTFLFSFLFFFFTYIIVKVYFKNKTYNRIVIFTFIGLLGISALLFATGKVFNIYSNLYGAVRTVMGMVQSFMPLMILAVLFNFLPQVKRD